MTFKNSTQCKRKGFTIIELLVATGVTALLVGIMITIISSVLGGWNRSSASLETGGQARIILDQLTQDIQGAIIRKDSNVWLAATIQATGGAAGITGETWTSSKPTGASSLVIPTPPGSGAMPDISTYRFGQGGVWLRMITNVSDTNTGALEQISAPRAVAYQIARIPVRSGSTEIRFQLFRSEVRPGHSTPALAIRSTFGQGYDLFKTGVDSYNTPTGSNSGEAEPGGIRRPDRTQLIGNNVIDFGVRFFTRNAAGVETLVFPVNTTTLAYAATNDTSKAEPTGATYAAGYPEVVEVAVRILSPEGVLIMEAVQAGNIQRPPEFATDAEYWWSIAETHSKVYTRRIEIKSKAI